MVGEKKYVYAFEEGNASQKSLLGGKGANLAEMTNSGMPVPPGFTITTDVCKHYYAHAKKIPSELDAQVQENLEKLEKRLGKKFGDAKNPLLVSVRSGAPLSMPGMMDTILNLGLNAETVKGLALLTKNERFAADSYRRFIQMYGNVVLDIDKDKFEHILDHVKKKVGAKLDTDLKAEDLQHVIIDYLELVQKETGKPFPTDPREQLKGAIGAVFGSWMNARAITYRKMNKISDDVGTAVNVQAMVFGNMGPDSGTGVAFTRNPSTGERKMFGEFLMNAQGEDVVAGIRTPMHIEELNKQNPAVYKEFVKFSDTLEKHYRDMQDMEFTIEKGKLFMLQTRNGKRTAAAAVKIAVDLAEEGLINKQEAILRVKPEELNQLLHRTIDPNAKVDVIATGLAASPGAASGEVVFDADTAEVEAQKGKKVLLVRPETTPDDIHGMIAAQGILTSRGGMTSHAAVVARGMGRTCVVGCEELTIDMAKKTITTKSGKVIKGGEWLSVDGSSGRVILGQVPTVEPKLTPEFKKLLEWADATKRLGVRANADIPRDAEKAFELGAEGIGLCRTEHMFFAPERLPVVQEMILAKTEADRRKALAKLLPFQRSDFIGLFEAMKGRAVTIRLIDPPLHEFLPQREELLVEVTILKKEGKDKKKLEEKEELLKRVNELHEFNPMLGLRGCRLGIVYPEIFEMQVQAIIEAAIAVEKKGLKAQPEIMIPLVGHVNELKVTADQAKKVADSVMQKEGKKVDYKLGTMIELPRAALTADEVVEHAEFFSFGTNDLTQTTFGFSRDDAEPKFLGLYVDKKILPVSPFITLDRNGVGKLMRMATEAGRKVKPKLKVGICGEHGGDPESIEFAHEIGLDYVSCSPYRVPIARLAAAHAAVHKAGKGHEHSTL